MRLYKHFEVEPLSNDAIARIKANVEIAVTLNDFTTQLYSIKDLLYYADSMELDKTDIEKLQHSQSLGYEILEV